jgi:hypothetical protein
MPGGRRGDATPGVHGVLADEALRMRGPIVSPKRIQMTRQRPWRAENPDAVIVARPSKWGNPFRVVQAPCLCWEVVDPQGKPFATHIDCKSDAHAQAVELFDLHVGPMGNYEYDAETLAELRSKLGGRDLACWCPASDRCHADVLLELANRED